MGQITSGIRAMLSNPVIYDGFQNFMGADRRRKEFANDHIRPIQGMRLLDIGCGTARILDYLPKSIVYYGFDLSQEYINEALDRYSDRGNFRCALVEEESLEGEAPFDLVLAIGVLHHLDDERAKKLMQIAKSALKAGGRLLTIDPCFDEGEGCIARFLVGLDRGQNVRTGKQYRGLALNIFDDVYGSVKYRKWIPYTHWIMECTK